MCVKLGLSSTPFVYLLKKTIEYEFLLLFSCHCFSYFDVMRILLWTFHGWPCTIRDQENKVKDVKFDYCLSLYSLFVMCYAGIRLYIISEHQFNALFFLQSCISHRFYAIAMFAFKQNEYPRKKERRWGDRKSEFWIDIINKNVNFIS